MSFVVERFWLLIIFVLVTIFMQKYTIMIFKVIRIFRLRSKQIALCKRWQMCDNFNTSFIANIFFFLLKLILLIHTSPLPTFILRIQCALVRPKPKYTLNLNYAVQKI